MNQWYDQCGDDIDEARDVKEAEWLFLSYVWS